MIEESDSMTIRKVIDNIGILMNGGNLTDESGNIVSFVDITLEDENGTAEPFTFNELSELTEYSEPMSAKEIAQAKEIADLKAELKARPVAAYSPRKAKTKYSKKDEAKIAGHWKQEKAVGSKITRKEFSKIYNISPGALTKILVVLGVEDKKTNKTKVTAKLKEEDAE